MDIEHKLDLIQQIRREEAESERNLYRKYRYKESVYRDYGGHGQKQSEEKEQISRVASFRLRLLLAVALFLFFFVMEKKEIEVEGIGYKEIVEYVGKNMDIKN